VVAEPFDRTQEFLSVLGELHPPRQLVRELPVPGRRRELTLALRFGDVGREIVKMALVHRPQSVAATALDFEP